MLGAGLRPGSFLPNHRGRFGQEGVFKHQNWPSQFIPTKSLER